MSALDKRDLVVGRKSRGAIVPLNFETRLRLFRACCEHETQQFISLCLLLETYIVSTDAVRHFRWYLPSKLLSSEIAAPGVEEAFFAECK